jgi:hypothetical protein
MEELGRDGREERRRREKRREKSGGEKNSAGGRFPSSGPPLDHGPLIGQSGCRLRADWRALFTALRLQPIRAAAARLEIERAAGDWLAGVMMSGMQSSIQYSRYSTVLRGTAESGGSRRTARYYDRALLLRLTHRLYLSLFNQVSIPVTVLLQIAPPFDNL